MKVTVELEVNQALMELIRENMETMSNVVAQGMPYWRRRMKSGGHGMGMIHHGQE